MKTAIDHQCLLASLSDDMDSPCCSSTSTCPTFAILLGLTSRLVQKEGCAWTPIMGFFASLIRFPATKTHLHIYVGIDIGDRVFDTEAARIRLRGLAPEGTCLRITRVHALRPGRVCALWKSLAKSAYADGCSLFTFLGDDVAFLQTDWDSAILNAFAQRPCGGRFGVVCFDDIACAGFPSFPVVSRLHLDIFGGEMFPDCFVNQDADPFLYQLYRRWGASVIVIGVARIRNGIGGHDAARYSKVHCTDWSHEILAGAVDRVAQWLRDHDIKIPRIISLDVLVPSYRCPVGVLRRIADMPTPPGMHKQTIIIIDNPSHGSVEDIRVLFHGREDVRVRVNRQNVGAPASRNRGLEESAAEWVLFLDDDVIPSPGLLEAYLGAIRTADGGVGGFVGITALPAPCSAFTSGLLLSGCTYFWTAAETFSSLPWGITANLVARRDRTRFRDCYPKTGGGEDIHYCLEHQGEFRSVASARCEHPWWSGGSRTYGHFFGWAWGDGQCVDYFPDFSYYAAPTPIVAASVVLVMLLFCWVLGAVSLGNVAMHCMVVCVGWTVGGGCFLEWYRLNRSDGNAVTCAAACEAWLIFCALESGRLLGHLSRGRPGNLIRRFDWFAGNLPSAVGEEKQRALMRFVGWLCGVVVYGATCWILSIGD